MKRILDIILAAVILFITWPIIALFAILVYLYDFSSPVYRAKRVGLGFNSFTMYKLRSMAVNADKSGVDSTSAKDPRITPVGHLIRAIKLDELTQLFNVLKGDMSLVGPRPNVKREVDLYTSDEKKLLSIRPGITDLSSVIFSDLADILSEESDPDIAYNQLVRPWKSRFGLLYINNRSILLDLIIIFITFVSIINRKYALSLIKFILQQLNAGPDLIRIAMRQDKLVPTPPPGATEIVTTRTSSTISV